ncbi:CocE/NonD family hydrolase [Citricoccus sp. SGAir0253]|uniref:CocE/NonD family hydrolase n=1 Tax=Citricoccus sp. SGAir0253 TaxID=2567881 RepID=UPI00143DABFC|nr:CocE/NonD family hydrolase [Citricoccus sp. SGAir0253]
MPDGPPFHLRFRAPRAHPRERGGEPPRPRTVEVPEVAGGMRVHVDLAIPVRSGGVARADLYARPDGVPCPVIVSWSPYGKHVREDLGVVRPTSGIPPGSTSAWTTFEAPDPARWVPAGYALLVVDAPGTWYSGRRATYCSPEEAWDFHDVIEWAAAQPWCDGAVGLSGVSYLTVSQWRVAELAPPHLRAINPWEGWTDTYREVARHGGIPETWFWPYIWDRWGFGAGEMEDLEAEDREHPWWDAFWASKAATPERVAVPALVVAGWADQGLHARGTLEGFRRLGSEDKWLVVHGLKKWAEYYRPENVELQLRFFDRFLKGVDNGFEDRPRVQLQVREAGPAHRTRSAASWPVEGGRRTALHLDAARGLMSTAAPAAAATVDYDALGSYPGPSRVEFRHRFEEDADVIGSATAVLYMDSPGHEDLDVFVALAKEDRRGRTVGFPFYGILDDGPVALGWLRASHRRLAEAGDAPFPVHAHDGPEPLGTVRPVRLDVEIWPSATHFAAGETLVLVVQGTDVKKYPKPLLVARHEDSVNAGRHVLHTGPAAPSRLELDLHDPA